MTAQPKQLPANPNLTQLKKQAKELQQAVLAADPDAISRVMTFHPSISSGDATLDQSAFVLRDAQATLAREYGFDGWHQLSTAVGEQMIDARDLHRWFGVQLNNGMWDAIEDPAFGPDTPRDQRELLLYSAYASAYHWRQVGTAVNAARGEHLISRMASKIDEPQVALRHARRCLEIVEHAPDEMEDWDAAFAHEALARALAGIGDLGAATEHLDRARSITSRLADEADRDIVNAELERPPWFGLQ